MKQFTVGALAYYDGTRCLIPCKVLEVVSPGGIGHGVTRGELKVKVTAARPGYARGEVISVSPTDTVPRSSVRFRKYSTRILNNYEWVTS